jgi:hypothetical protein
MAAKLAVLTVGAMLALTASAEATTVSASSTTNRVTVNDTTSSVDDRLVFTVRDNAGAQEAVVTDSATALTPGTGCVQGTSIRQVVCTHANAGGNFTLALVTLGDGDDSFSAANVNQFGATISGGDGHDEITGTRADATNIDDPADQRPR